jgi:ribosomal protein S27AE
VTDTKSIQSLARWCWRCGKYSTVTQIQKDRDAWQCGKCKTITTGRDAIIAGKPPKMKKAK